MTRSNSNGEPIEIRNGQCRNSKGQLAGSTLTMNQAVRNASEFAKIEIGEALRMAGLYPGPGGGTRQMGWAHSARLHRKSSSTSDEDLAVHGTLVCRHL